MRFVGWPWAACSDTLSAFKPLRPGPRPLVARLAARLLPAALSAPPSVPVAARPGARRHGPRGALHGLLGPPSAPPAVARCAQVRSGLDGPPQERGRFRRIHQCHRSTGGLPNCASRRGVVPQGLQPSQSGSRRVGRGRRDLCGLLPPLYIRLTAVCPVPCAMYHVILFVCAGRPVVVLTPPQKAKP
eukprot:scaffold20041_cov52-Phaeocystis_antarctica.AAC.2